MTVCDDQWRSRSGSTRTSQPVTAAMTSHSDAASERAASAESVDNTSIVKGGGSPNFGISISARAPEGRVTAVRGVPASVITPSAAFATTSRGVPRRTAADEKIYGESRQDIEDRNKR